MRGELTMAASSGRAQRHLDHFEAEARGVRIVDVAVLATGHFFGRAHARRAGHIDIDVAIVAGLADDGVRVRAAARLHGRDELRTA